MNATASAAPRIAPGPEGRFLIGNVPEMRRDPMQFFVDVIREYGDVVRLHLVQDVHLLNHPDHIKHVLQDNHTNYLKGFGYERMEPLVGKGLLTSEGDFWKRQRRLAQPAFHRQRIAGFAELMIRRTEAMVSGWSPGGAVDAHTEMMKLTFGIVGEALFSIDLVKDAEATSEALTLALQHHQRPVRAVLRLPPRGADAREPQALPGDRRAREAGERDHREPPRREHPGGAGRPAPDVPRGEGRGHRRVDERPRSCATR